MRLADVLDHHAEYLSQQLQEVSDREMATPEGDDGYM